MPICIQNDLPVKNDLLKEDVVVIEENRAKNQDIRPLKILILNLMPKKEETERQLLRLLGNSPLQIKVEFLHVATHIAKNTANSYLEKFYTTFSEIKNEYYDGLIITGAPIEHLKFEEVDYWEELKEIFKWSKTHIFSTLNICWAAQASLYYHYRVKKEKVSEKIFGVFEHEVLIKNHALTRGFTDVFLAPHSRHTKIEEDKLLTIDELEILAKTDKAGTLLITTKNLRKIFITGHIEYEADTLHNEYIRDKSSGLPIEVPFNYYPENDDTKEPKNTWRCVAYLFYHNWLNQVYQLTPYDLKNLEK
ncbi:MULTISPECIES: homoserine O-succinyltransferase [Gemella]|uniref:homoserine O-succinyltransferase n=1 Tax=Gemella TaxID=1378 RepID=UPI000767F8A9|nr:MULTISPECIES: homoserine O-succinyltransferase [Gemella]AME09033.1 homoserine O-succinyltransferase [Gemella sp. oral taxon 928]AXI26603.1 homoserine O-succinyltransferase [Gemella sp. ND 6198]